MGENVTGPLLSDRRFFQECLNLEYEGMQEVKASVLKEDFCGARKAMAAYIRRTLDPERFFTIPYEAPENIYKFPEESDEDACRRICRHTLISVGVPCEYGEGKPVDWKANPTYNGYREWTWQLNRHNDWKLLAHEYRRTHNRRLAETAAELFTSWVRQAVYPGDCPGYSTDCWRTIECGIRMGANWPYILFTFYNTEPFTDDILIDWYKSVWEHGERLSRNHMTGNWLIMEMNGLAQIGILYPQFILSGQWLSQALGSLEEELDRQIYPDGFQYELSTGYADVVVNNYQRLIEVAKAFGKTVSEGMLEKLAKACELDVKLMMPDGCVPDINDGKHRNVEETFQCRKRIFPENKTIRWITEKFETGEPDFTSIALPWSGFLVMRTGWTTEDSWALFDAAPFGKAHQHEDKLSLLFYANGKLLLTEGGNYAYDTSEMRRYVLSTRAHNTVRVDAKDQNRLKNYAWKEEDIREKADLKWRLGPVWDYGESNYREGYGENPCPGTVHNRRVFFNKSQKEGKPPFLVVVDRMASDEIHRYEWLWHIDSELEAVQKGRISFHEIDAAFSAGEAEVIEGREEPEWQGFKAVGTKQGMYRKLPCVSIKADAGQIRIVTVLSPCKGLSGRVHKVTASAMPEEDSVVISFEDGTEIAFREQEIIQTV